MTIKEIKEKYKEQTGHHCTSDGVYIMWLEMTLAKKWTVVGSLLKQNVADGGRIMGLEQKIRELEAGRG